MEKVAQKLEKGNYLFCPIDLHDRMMLVGFAVDKGEPRYRQLDTREESGERKLREVLRGWQEANPGGVIWVAYEASGSGFGLADRLGEAGFRVKVLAPSHLPSSAKSRSEKTDRKDCLRILEVLRGHVLAGNQLHAVWIPGLQLRDDRELVRRRLRMGEEITRVKNQIQGLLKRNGQRRPEGMKTAWGLGFRAWLKRLMVELSGGAGATLASHLRELEFYEAEKLGLERGLRELARQPRYQAQVERMMGLKGVGLLTAMVFATEMGELSRFGNRKSVGCYLGLTPRRFQSGEETDHSGHISRLGPARVRKVLNQAAWAVVRYELAWGEWFAERIAGQGPAVKKIMITAVMRRLGIWLWHQGMSAVAA
jgi:transposase